LIDEGAEVALRAVTRWGSIPVTLTATGVQRHSTEIEAGLYFGCLEALQNASKHAEATTIAVDIREEDGTLQFTVTDDGRGFRPGATTGGMAALTDRVESVGGSLTVRSEPGSGTTVQGTIPLRAFLVEDA
jgi:signal transduction histidine kinase